MNEGTTSAGSNHSTLNLVVACISSLDGSNRADRCLNRSHILTINAGNDDIDIFSAASAGIDGIAVDSYLPISQLSLNLIGRIDQRADSRLSINGDVVVVSADGEISSQLDVLHDRSSYPSIEVELNSGGMGDGSGACFSQCVFVAGRELLEASVFTGSTLDGNLFSNGSADGGIVDVDVAGGVIDESSTRAGSYHGSLDSVFASLACLNGCNRADRSLDRNLWGNFLRTRQEIEGRIYTAHIIVRAIAAILTIVLNSLLDIIVGNHHSSIFIERNGPIDTL